MKKTLALFMATAMFAPSAFAAEITPYVGVGLVIDKAGTSAKRVRFDPSQIQVPDMSTIGNAFIPNAGSDMDFDMAFAGEITAGVRIGNVRAELEAAIRSASEDDYEIYNGDIVSTIIGTSLPGITLPTEIETSTSVRHNSYLFNMYYDFDLGDSNWTPYIGAGVGLGVYRQKASVEIDVDDAALAAISQIPGVSGIISQIPFGEMEVANDTLYEFEWQVGIGTAYNFTENWAMDIGYRFNSSNVADEFVYAHEIKVGARYTF